jgi:DNA-binding transcriptional MocR family regulator
MHKLILLAIADYAGRDNNSAWPAITTLAARCGVSRITAVRAVRELEKLNLVSVENRSNKTNIYRLPVDEKEGYQRDTPYQKDTPVVSERYSGGIREIPEPVRNQLGTSKDDEQVESLYAAYPRKVGKPAALASIRKAIKREAAKADLGMTPAALLAKTRLWATACQQRTAEEPDSAKYIKHPATWFNQQGYLEPAAEWGIKQKPKSLSSQLNDEVLRASNRDLERTRKLLESL